MAAIRIDQDLCIGCGLCVRVCANDGVKVESRRASITENCIACGLCIDACPKGALSREASHTSADLSAWSGMMVVAQTDKSATPLPVAYELVGAARDLAHERGCSLRVLVVSGSQPGCQCTGGYASLIDAGADEVLVVEDPAFAIPDGAAIGQAVAQVIEQLKPEAVLFGATDLGREVAPRVARELSCGLTADCTQLALDQEGLLLQTRPAFGGNLLATIASPATRPQMATVRPGVFSRPEPQKGRCGTIYHLTAAPSSVPGIQVLSEEPASSGASIADAEVLVVVGRGIRDKKALPTMERLAALLGGQVACTRPVVEAGWMGHESQVGQTGVSVAPRVLVSMGVSGAIQHLAGISGAKTVIAVNEDPDAPIFSVAQAGAVADCRQVADEWVKFLEEAAGHSS